jgi:predicted signal transduction protein with EAL and GGDEF domain
MARQNARRSIDKPEDCPTAWFAVLERARLDDDFERASEAVRQLRRLGVRVKFDCGGKGASYD